MRFALFVLKVYNAYENRADFNTNVISIQIDATIRAVVLVQHSILHGIILTNPSQIIKLCLYIKHITLFFRSNTRTVLGITNNVLQE